jgi:cellulose synthase/poly-beta-1,6-N-acetylglucosamine synthase-like glycosyltransferase
VIIPVYNGEQTLGRCLEALTHQTLPLSEYEILVVDDGSSDQTREVVSLFPARLLVQPHRGPAAARNLAIRAAAGEIVLFTDADTEPTQDWIETMLTVFQDKSVAGAKGAYRTRQKEWTARFVQIEYEEKYARMARAKRVDVVDTYSAGYRREVALFDGGFDESFPSASVEDAEFSFRLAKQGYRFVFLPDAIVYHHHAATLWAYCRRKFKIGYWRVRVHARHPDKAISDAHTPPTQKLQMLLCPLLIPLGISAWLIPHGWLLFAFVLGGFLLTMLPLTWRAFQKDFTIGLLAPLFIASRALALSGGAVVGVISEVRRSSVVGRIVSTFYRKSSSNCPG